MNVFAVLVVDRKPESTRLWLVEGDVETAEKIEEITGMETQLMPVLSFDSFWTNLGKRDGLVG